MSALTSCSGEDADAQALVIAASKRMLENLTSFIASCLSFARRVHACAGSSWRSSPPCSEPSSWASPPHHHRGPAYPASRNQETPYPACPFPAFPACLEIHRISWLFSCSSPWRGFEGRGCDQAGP